MLQAESGLVFQKPWVDFRSKPCCFYWVFFGIILAPVSPIDTILLLSITTISNPVQVRRKHDRPRDWGAGSNHGSFCIQKSIL